MTQFNMAEYLSAVRARSQSRRAFLLAKIREHTDLAISHIESAAGLFEQLAAEYKRQADRPSDTEGPEAA